MELQVMSSYYSTHIYRAVHSTTYIDPRESPHIYINNARHVYMVTFDHYSGNISNLLPSENQRQEEEEGKG
jgi:hypothetical protein